MKKTFFVEDDFVNTRLDKWIRKKLFDIPQSLIEKNIRKGNIKVNNNKYKSSYRLKEKDQINIKNFNFTPNISRTKLNKYIPAKKELSSFSKLFVENNENFAVINKPAGIAVQAGTKSRRNIIDVLKNTKEFEGFKPFPVHRIDKETTGILIVAKNRKYAQLFTSLFRIRKIHKTYLGIAVGELKKNKGVLIDQLFYYEGNKKTVTKATTNYTVIDSNNNYSFLKLNPETGRKHQIRKQLLIHGCPILGDNKYRIPGGFKNNKKSLMLHAYKINFSIDGIKYKFFAELPLEFKNTLKEKYLKIF